MGLSTRQDTALRALVNAFLPPLPVPPSSSTSSSENPPNEDETEGYNEQAHQVYWQHRLADDPAYLDALQTCLTNKLSTADAWQVQALLTALSTSIGTSLVFGRPTLKAFTDWSTEERSNSLRQLATSRILARRQVLSSLKRLVCGLAYSYADQQQLPNNPHWRAMGYRGPPQTWVEDDAARAASAQHERASIRDAIIAPSDNMECDVVIVGSGAGGSVAASVLSKAGYQVLVLEKGKYEDVTNLEADAMDCMYESHGLLTSADKNIMVLAGSTLGGGMTVNWSCCLPLPEHVRQEWKRYGLDLGADYDHSLEVVLERIGASDRSKVTQNAMNTKLQQGAQAMGYPYETCGQNLRETDDPSAGYVCFGDRYGNKNNFCFLQDAVDHGCKIVQECRVERVLWERENGQKRATGVECRVKDQTITIRAKCVIVSAGSLHTPCLLQRSGFRNRNIGKHLRLHPTTAVMGFMKEDIDGYLEAPLTTVCNEFAQGPLQDGYGAKMECPSAHPGLLAAGITWTTPQQFKERLVRFRNAATYIVIQRDSGEGSVRLERDGITPRIDYVVNKTDKKSLAKAIQGGLYALLAGGAEEVASPHVRDPGFVYNGPRDRDGITSDESVQNYMAELESWGMTEHEVAMFSAHQMGSCRMSLSPRTGAVDTNGETWDCSDLFVMDASLFPTASAANPMITVLTLAHMLSKRLALTYRLRDETLTEAREIAQAKELVAQRTELRSCADNRDAWLFLVDNSVRIAIWLVILAPLFWAWVLESPWW